tara:strand:+ start:445 stop:627 length:183 start_codon:yes stop_codon:yes gene_type:complete
MKIKPMAGEIEKLDWSWSLGCIEAVDPSIHASWGWSLPPWRSFPVTQVRIEIQSGVGPNE